MTKLEDDVPEAIAIAHDARDHAFMANTLADGAFAIAKDVRAMLRAQQRSLQALRETQVEHGQRLDRLENKVDEGFTKVALGMSRIAALIKNIERG